MPEQEIITTRKNGFIIHSYNPHETEEIWKEVFVDGQYRSEKPARFIVDLGSHIGLSVLYFKMLFPDCKIIAVEANPGTYNLLLKNINANNLTNVVPLNYAVSNISGKMPLFLDPQSKEAWSWGDSIVPNIWGDASLTESIQVQAKRLEDIVKESQIETIDILKIDIEGMEYLVLQEFKDQLYRVDRLFMEFHHTKNNLQNDVSALLELLSLNFSNIELVDSYSFFDDRRVDIEVLKKAERIIIGINASK